MSDARNKAWEDLVKKAGMPNNPSNRGYFFDGWDAALKQAEKELENLPWQMDGMIHHTDVAIALERLRGEKE